MKIAFLSCHNTLSDAPNRRPDAYEHDHQIAALRQGLTGTGVAVVEIDWRAPMAEFAGIALAVLGTIWDYQDHWQEFLTRIDELTAAGVTLCNAPEVVRWNVDKSYLRALAERGVPTVPTLWPEAPCAPDIRAAFDHFGVDRVVTKRRVGAGASGQSLFTREAGVADGWTMDRPGMIQPFLPAICDEGELSFLFVDGDFSHAIRKQPAAGDYRVQALYGAQNVALSPAPEDLSAARRVLAELPFTDLLYARIDMVRGADGGLLVMEAELIEPYLYPLQGPELGPRLAHGILRRLGMAQPR